MARPIADFALLGDCRSAALVSRDGSVDWLCWPRFDSPALFAALLDEQRGGSFRLSPTGIRSIRRRYLPGSAILETVFTCDGGEVALTDFMPLSDEQPRTLMPENELLRQARGLSGEVELEIAFVPRPKFGLRPFRVKDAGALGVRAESGRELYTLCSEVPVRASAGAAYGRVRLRAGESVHVSLCASTTGPGVLVDPRSRFREALEATARYWRRWSGRLASFDPRWQDEVVRSAVTLKLMTFAPTGAVIAAPTTSLPEKPGGDWNWDYRYSWLRDAAFTMRALVKLGVDDESSQFLEWLLHTTRLTRPELKVFYDLYGCPPPRERELPFAGYEGARPVRVGNGARDQLQVDVYGEVIEAAGQIAEAGVELDRATQKMLYGFGRYLCEHARDPDQGIWEPREPPAHHTHSRLLAWVGLDRLLMLMREGYVRPRDVDRFVAERRALEVELRRRFYDPAIGSYVATLGRTSVDASGLLLSWYDFEQAGSQAMRGTERRIVERLGGPRGLVWRNEEMRGGGEGAFLLCSFWLLEQLAERGDVEAAERLLEELCGHANDVGLFSEEVDAGSGAALGNFPQAYTHVGFLNAVMTLDRQKKQLGRPGEAEARP